MQFSLGPLEYERLRNLLGRYVATADGRERLHELSPTNDVASLETEHALTAEAIVKSDRSLLLRALCTDPLCVSIADAREMIEEVLAEERDAMPAAWYQR